MVLERGLKHVGVHGGRFKKKILYSDNTALVSDSTKSWCRLLTEFGRDMIRENLSKCEKN